MRDPEPCTPAEGLESWNPMPGPTAEEAEANPVLSPAPPEPGAATRLRADLFSTQPPPPRPPVVMATAH